MVLTIYGVEEISKELTRLCTDRFSFMWIKGEVCNCSSSSSGNLYFSLREGSSILDCVWFSSRQQETISHNIVTGEVREEDSPCLSKTIKNGDYVYLAGIVIVYQERSKYQFCVEFGQYVGEGKYKQYLNNNYSYLLEEGLFDNKHKKVIPRNPDRIAVITSREGAALQDFLYVANDRGVGCKLYLYNSTIQGEQTVADIKEAINKANKMDIEVIVVIRGGGSQEEIAIFNDEDIVRQIFLSNIPIITGIGHEIDRTLSDLVADASGITPTFVGNMLFEDRAILYERTVSYQNRLYKGALDKYRSYTASIIKVLSLLSLYTKEQILLMEKRLISIQRRYSALFFSLFNNKIQKFTILVYLYHNIYKYIYSQNRQRELLKLTENIYKNIHIFYRDRYLYYQINKKRLERYSFYGILNRMLGTLCELYQRMSIALKRQIAKANIKLNNCFSLLELLSPEYMMKRGYIYVEDRRGKRIRNASSLNASSLYLHFHDGTVCVELK